MREMMPSYFFVSHSSTIVSAPLWFGYIREGILQGEETHLGSDVEVRFA